MSNQSDEKKPEPTTDPGTPRAKVNHGQADPEADPLFKTLYQMVQTHPANPSTVLEWLELQSAAVVRRAVYRSQTAPWSIAAEPLVDSLQDDQARAVLAAIVVGVYQGRMTR